MPMSSRFVTLCLRAKVGDPRCIEKPHARENEARLFGSCGNIGLFGGGGGLFCLYLFLLVFFGRSASRTLGSLSRQPLHFVQQNVTAVTRVVGYASALTARLLSFQYKLCMWF